jgi:hypothetical protein
VDEKTAAIFEKWFAENIAEPAAERARQLEQHVLKLHPAPEGLPIGNSTFFEQTEVFARKVMSWERESGPERRFRKQTEAGQLVFDFAEIAPGRPGADRYNTQTPSVHTNTRAMLWAMLFFTFQTKALNAADPLGGTATARDFFDAFGVERPHGRDYDRLLKLFYAIATQSVRFDNMKKGEARQRWGYAFTNWYEITGEGEGMRFWWTFNPPAVSPVTVAFIKDELTPELAAELGGYVSYPRRYLSEPLPAHLDNIRHALLTHRWGRKTSYLTILKKWGRVPEAQLNRVAESTALAESYFSDLKKHGVIGDYYTSVEQRASRLRKGQPAPLRDRKVIFAKPGARTRLTLRGDARKQFDEILEWLTRLDDRGNNIHGTATEPAKIREQLERAVRRHGMARVHREFLTYSRGAKPSPPEFWAALYPPERRTRKPKPAAKKRPSKPTPAKPKPNGPTRTERAQRKREADEHDRRRKLQRQLDEIRDAEGEK